MNAVLSAVFLLSEYFGFLMESKVINNKMEEENKDGAMAPAEDAAPEAPVEGGEKTEDESQM